MNQGEAMEQSSYKFDSENLLWNRHKMSFLGLIVSRPLLLSKFTSVIGGRISNDNADGNFLKYSSSAEYVRRASQSDYGNVFSQKREGVAVYPRSLRAYRKKRTSPECLEFKRNCIETVDFSISFHIILLH